MGTVPEHKKSGAAELRILSPCVRNSSVERGAMRYGEAQENSGAHSGELQHGAFSAGEQSPESA